MLVPVVGSAGQYLYLVAGFGVDVNGGGFASNDGFEEWAHFLLQPPAFEPQLWFLAEEREQAGGFAICHPHPSDPMLGWIGVLGVRRAWRRRGLARALLLHAFREFRRCGLRRAGLGVDAENLTGANRLYEALDEASMLAPGR